MESLTLRSMLSGARAQLRAVGIGSPGLDAELLLAHALSSSRSALLARLDETARQETIDAYRSLVERRAAREPVAYLTGWKEFWGRAFEVDRSVLIPRPETELLVERALGLARPGDVVVDVGTGSGCIAVSLALDLPDARVVATDSSPESLAVARRNAERLGAASRVEFLEGNLLKPVRGRARVVVANLPYIPTVELDGLEPEVRLWEPRAALDGGPDGLDPIRALLAQLSGHTAAGLVCLLEIDPRQYPALEEEVSRVLPSAAVRAWRDLSDRVRVAEIAPFTPS